MITSEIEKLWYKALFEEDCLEVKELLRKNPELLKVGWKRDESRKVKGSPDNHWKPEEESSWMGRTALHVGARRGDIELVQQVLILCEIPDAALLARATGAGAKDDWGHQIARDDWRHQIHLNIECKDCGMHPISGPRFQSRKVLDYDLCFECFVASGAEENEYATMYSLAGRTRRKFDQNANFTPDSAQENSPIAAAAVGAGNRTAAENSSATSTPQVLLKSPRVDEGCLSTIAPTDSREGLLTPRGQLARGESEGAGCKGEDIAGSHEDCAVEGNKAAVGESGEALKRYKASRAEFSSLDSKITRDGSESLWDGLVSITELGELLLCKDGQYKLDALAMTTLQGNLGIVVLLVYALGEFDRNPYRIAKMSTFRTRPSVGNDSRQMIELTKVTKKVIDYFRSNERDFMAACEEEYRRHRDFNFLPLEEYLFHFSWSSRFEDVFHEFDKEKWRRRLWRMVRKWPQPQEQELNDEGESDGQENSKEHTKPDGHEKANDQEKKPSELWQFLLRLHDGQGRAPMHVAVDEGTHQSFTEAMVGGITHLAMLMGAEVILGDEVACAATARDGSGKIAVHRAAVMAGKVDRRFWLKFFSGLKGVLTARCSNGEHPMRKAFEEMGVDFFEADIDIDMLSVRNGFRSRFEGCTPLDSAIIHNNLDFGRILFQFAFHKSWNPNYAFDLSVHDCSEENESSLHDFMNADRSRHSYYKKVNIMELACFVGLDFKWIKLLLQEKCSTKHEPPVLHLVAAYGNYKALTLLIDNCDPFAEDNEGNGALHYVMRDGVSIDDQNVQFVPHLLDYVSCQQLLLNYPWKKKKIVDDNFVADRQGCINALLQAGCDIFRANKVGKVPYPEGMLSCSSTFLSWWYEKQNKEFAALQSSLNNAANAISVTATLVATASFVGPLQPPRSYTDDNQMEYENSWVATFLFCDTISFYFAIVAIVLSIIPSLPVPQQAMFDELRRTRITVTMAVGVLFPSIVGVLLAFASSSIAVVSPGILSDQGRNLAVTSVSIGGLLIFAAFSLFLVRLLGICFPGNSWIRYLYKLTSF